LGLLRLFAAKKLLDFLFKDRPSAGRKFMKKVAEMLREDRRLPLALLFVFVVTVAIYYPALHHAFIDYDDNDYVTANAVVSQGLTLKGFLWAFSAFHAANWHPLTWLSHMLDVQLFDLNPMGHHAVSVLIHAANSLFLCLLLRRLTGHLGRSLVVALLFALHPLHVESVAWVSERKDVLSTFFWFLTMWCYAGYAEHPAPRRYLAVALSLALGLMAKQMLVTLPVLLLLLDIWPLRRLPQRGWKALLLEKLPLLGLAAAAALVTIVSQRASGALTHRSSSVLIDSGNALISYLRYIRHMFWPVDLALFYPFDPAAVTVLAVSGSVLVLALVSWLALSQRNRRPYLLFGWFWYLVTLLPVIGFLRAGDQAMADRYTYVPLIGLFLIVVWGGAELGERWGGGSKIAAAVAGLLLTVLSVLTVIQIGYWRTSYDVFDHALKVVDRNWVAHNNMGILLARQFRLAEAIPHFQESIRINPDGAVAYKNLGTALQSTGNAPQAIEAFQQAVRIDPADGEGHYRLGYAYLMGGRSDLAYQQYQELAALDPAHAAPLLESIRMSGRR
jgi:protein O-mannosyl-transferase